MGVNLKHKYYGFSRYSSGINYREWIPNAKEVYIMGDFNKWNKK